MIVNFI